MKAYQVVRVAVLALGIASVSCGSAREGTGTSFLIIDGMEFSEPGEGQSFIGNAISDVETVVDDVPTTFSDLARVRFRLGLKDPGPAGTPTLPTQNQFITIDRYHVRYFRGDGRNTQGVDVPYGFDGAFTATIGAASPQPVFTYVRHTAKHEAPLAALRTNGIIITIIAEITFYGQDQTGHEVSATSRVSVEFGNFGDPD